MTTALVVLVTLAAGPQAPPGAEVVIHVPRLDAAGPLVDFAAAAGEHSAMVRPSSWRESLVPVVAVDITRGESLAALGIDGKGPLTSSRVGDFQVACMRLAAPDRFTAAARSAVERLGQPFQRREGGVRFTGSKDQLGRVLGAVGVKGADACTLGGGGLSVEKQLNLVVSALSSPLSLPVAGQAVALLGPGGDGSRTVVGLAARGTALDGELRTSGTRLPALAGAGPSSVGAFAPAGLAVLRARVAPGEIPSLTRSLAAAVPLASARQAVAEGLAPLLTGAVAAVVTDVEVSQGLRTPAARFFASRLAVVAEVKDPARAREAVSAIPPAALTSREGKVSVTVVGEVLVVANDERAREVASAALTASRGTHRHGVELTLSPRAVARGLTRVPLLEAVQSPGLAGLVALSAELGPLLTASSAMGGWADSAGAGKHRGAFTWTLGSPGASDGGVP